MSGDAGVSATGTGHVVRQTCTLRRERHGATVVALARRKPANWRDLIQAARASAGTLVLPLSKPLAEGASDEELASAAGADLMVDTPEIGAWLVDTLAALKMPTTVGL